MLVLSVVVSGLERFPPPEFETDYVRPTTTMPHPRQDLWEYIDTGVLLASLALATYLVFRRRSRRGIFALMLFSLIYFGFFRKGCVCSIGAIQNVVLTAFDPAYAVPIAVLIFFCVTRLSPDAGRKVEDRRHRNRRLETPSLEVVNNWTIIH